MTTARDALGTISINSFHELMTTAVTHFLTCTFTLLAGFAQTLIRNRMAADPRRRRLKYLPNRGFEIRVSREFGFV
jgi:hypothetical protein